MKTKTTPLSLVTTQVRLVEAEGDKRGREWEVEIIQAGASTNGFYYSPQVLREATPLFEGVRALVRPDELHLKDMDKSAKNIVGWFSNPVYSGNKIKANFHISEAADWLRTLMLDAWERGKKDIVGFSLVAEGVTRIKRQGREFVRHVDSIKKVFTVDVVVEAAAGGRIIKLAEAANKTQEEELEMLEQLLKLIESKAPEVYKKINLEDVTLEQVTTLLVEAAVSPKQADTKPVLEVLGELKTLMEAQGQAGQPGQNKEGATLLVEAQKILDESKKTVRLAECRALMAEKLAGAKLPKLAHNRVKKLFADKAFEDAELDTAIKDEREYLAEASKSGQVAGLGLPKFEQGLASREQIQYAVDRLFGLDVPKEADGLPRLKGLREAYVRLSGDQDITGRFCPERIGGTLLTEAFDSTTFSYILGNTLNRRMLMDYAAVEYHERKIINIRPGVSDFKTQEAVREGYFGDLSDVDPEAQNYQEIGSYRDEEATYAVGQKGNLLTITEKHIRNDDLGRVVKKTSRLGRAARRTFARFVWNMLIDNITYTVDEKAIFHGDHGNLGSTSLGVSTLEAAAQALALMTEPGSGEVLGWPSEKFNLFIPVQLRGAAIKSLESPDLPGGPNNDKNPVYQIADIHIVPLLTDVNDWLFTCPSIDRDIIEVAFMDGREEPQMYLADNPAVGQMFLADKLQYKIKHQYGGTVVDYRGAYKAVVA